MNLLWRKVYDLAPAQKEVSTIIDSPICAAPKRIGNALLNLSNSHSDSNSHSENNSRRNIYFQIEPCNPLPGTDCSPDNTIQFVVTERGNLEDPPRNLAVLWQDERHRIISSLITPYNRTGTRTMSYSTQRFKEAFKPGADSILGVNLIVEMISPLLYGAADYRPMECNMYATDNLAQIQLFCANLTAHCVNFEERNFW